MMLHFMNLKKWKRLEIILDEYNIKLVRLSENLDNEFQKNLVIIIIFGN